ncbi:unnamed protein product [Brassica oleracea var. botrytis]
MDPRVSFRPYAVDSDLHKREVDYKRLCFVELIISV